MLHDYMKYSKRIVLHCPNGYQFELDGLIEEFIKDGVKYVAVVGKDCSKVEDIIHELLVGDGCEENSFILTSFHEDESVKEVVKFADSLILDGEGKSQIIQL